MDIMLLLAELLSGDISYLAALSFFLGNLILSIVIIRIILVILDQFN